MTRVLAMFRERLALVVLLTAAAPLAAQTPLDDEMSYQGLLTQGGTPFTGTATVEFRLFGVETGGSALATDPFGSQSITDGLLSFCVDFGPSAFDGDERWIEVVIDATPLVPRQAICAAPYALFALSTPGGISDGHSLDAADGSPVNATFVDADGQVLILGAPEGVVDAETELDVRNPGSTAPTRIRAANKGANTWVMLWSGFSNGSNDPAIIWSDDAASDDLRFLNGSVNGTGGTEKMRITGAGNVGVGTPTPAHELDVRSTSPTFAGNIIAANNNADTFLMLHSGHTAGSDDPAIIWSDDVAGDDLRFMTMNLAGSTGTERMRLTGAGNVGIGTPSPVNKLHVFDATTGTFNPTALFQRNDHTYIRLLSPDAKERGIVFGDDLNASDGGIYYSSTDTLEFRTAGNAIRMRLDSLGKLGLGISTIPSKFTLYEGGESTTQTTFTQALTNAGINIVTDYTSGNYTPGVFWSTTNNNATKPKAGIYLQETGTGTKMFLGTSNNYATGITNDALTIDQAGNLGIGATAPAVKLHVEGDEYVDGDLTARDSSDFTRIKLDSGTPTTVSEFSMSLFDGASGVTQTVSLTGGKIFFPSEGGALALRSMTGGESISLSAPGSSGGGTIVMRDGGGITQTVEILSQGTGGGSEINLDNSAGATTLKLDADAVTEAGELSMFAANGTETVEIQGDNGDGASLFRMRGAAGQNAVIIDASGGTGDEGAEMSLRNAGGQASIFFDSNFDGLGHGKVTTDVLEIEGADLAEKFPASDRPEPGMVMQIDPDNPGKLRIASGAYNRLVAGVVSGANDFSVGVVLGNKPGHENAPAIALTGRVYVHADAAYGAIQLGDLLTTSDTPGHAMKVVDHDQAQGAILGKAMSTLDGGKGLVLVLVSLQ